MMEPRHEMQDDELRTAFARMAQEDSVRRPALDAMLVGVHTPSALRDSLFAPGRALRWFVPAAATLALVLWIGASALPEWRFRRAVSAWSASPAGGAWQSTTSFLLAVPGGEFLRTVPRIGVGLTPAQDGARADDARQDSTGGERT